MKISEAFEGENSSLRKAYDEAVAPQTNMENKEEKHGWDKNGGVYHCSDGTHSSWWLSIAKTPQWEAWYKYASKNMLYDVDESLECGWMSEQHAKDFMEFTDKQGYMRALKDVEKALPKEKQEMGKDDWAIENDDYLRAFNSAIFKAHNAISKLKEKV